MNRVSHLLWGVFLVIIGVIFGLNALEITDINIFFDGWWCFIIIIPCFIDLFKDKDKSFDIIGIIVGTILFLGCQSLISFELILKLVIPLILVLSGLSFIFRDLLNSKVKKEIKKINKKSGKEYYATFGGQNLNFDDEEFTGCSLNSIFGGIKCDLKDAIIKKDTVINASSIFGGITIYVPDNVKIKINSTPIFGGVSDERKNRNTESEITLYINSTCIFGGIEIK